MCLDGDAMAKQLAIRAEKEASHAASATAANKKLFIKALAAGNAPGCAAAAIGIDRSTAYAWKKADKAFSTAWENAVETSLDKLETELFIIAKDDPDHVGPRIKAIDSMLRNRRYGNGESRSPAQQTNFIMNVTMEEHFKRCQRLGLPVPEIECDYEDEDGEARLQQR